MLSPDEQALFKERIRFLDKKIHPGLKKLHWALKGASAFFITECRIHASKVGHGHSTLKVCKADWKADVWVLNTQVLGSGGEARGIVWKKWSVFSEGLFFFFVSNSS